MTTTANGATTNLARFQDLLGELFQFDCADLDFGIYRIMNHKRDAVERFITEQLPATVATELDSGPLAQQAQASAKLGEVAQRVRATLGENAINDHGVLAAAHHELPIGQEYLEAQARAADGSRSRDAVEAAIYNHLYTFFSRYYDEGDFISKRRYSRNQRYAIPYNGEEVYLHWANSDQYYVKTDEHFRNYDWKAPNGVTVRFRLKNADVEQNNVKGDRRFFIPRISETEWDGDSAVITIPFEYRPLSAGENVTYGTTNQQDKIITDAVSAIPEQMRDNAQATAALGGEHRRDGNGPISHLEHHLRQYVRRNNSDFFIHKDLATFLNRELDFYLKNDVLNLENLAVAGQDMAEGWFQQMRLAKAVGSKIIKFLAQIEEFQKMLWEKRKFVTETQYCITLGNIAPEFYPEVAANDAQWAEWRELFGIEGSDRSEAFLSANPTLVLDTKHFGAGFIDRLLASFDDLDGMMGGLLIHSENWQALNILTERYRSGVDCIYIDPPYNTGDSEILYKNGYLNSSWLTLMENRLTLAMPMLADDPFLFVAIDDFEVIDICELIDKHFPFLRRDMIIVNHHPQGGKARTLASTHEYMVTCLKGTSSHTLVGRGNGVGNNLVERRPFKRSGTAESNFRYARPNSFYAVLLDPQTKQVVGIEKPPESENSNYPIGSTKEGYVRVYPLGTNGDERVWRNSFESGYKLFESQKLESSKTGTIYQLIEPEERSSALFSNWVGPRYNAGTFGANLLSDIIGRHNSFPYPKSIHTVGDALFATGIDDGSCCLDYFAGSGTTGHAVINLNREDGGERKFILVEMGEYFDTVLLPRVKKVTYTPEWKDGKPQRQATAEEAERSPRIVKYLRLESYEDALDSIDLDQPTDQLHLPEPSEEYLLRYMLSWETKDSGTLLNPARLASPFSYRLGVHVNGEKQERWVDLAETFNYLLGLKVQTRKALDDNGRRYLLFRGETRAAPGRRVAVIWRETEGWAEADFARDRDFVEQHNLGGDADTVYVNGDSAIPGAKPIESMFKARMFASVND